MSITRKMLKGMGLTDEAIDTIIEAHSETVEALKAERDTYKADAEKLPAVQKAFEDLKGTSGDYEQKYNDLKKQFDTYKSEQTAKAEKTAKETANKEMLKGAGISDKRIASIMKVTSLDGVELDKDGKLKNIEQLTENAKTEWADFIDTHSKAGADVKTPPANTGGNLTKDDILKIKDASERQQKIAENHELFGF